MKMVLYLVFGSCDGFGNDCFLSAITRTKEEAEEELLNTFHYGTLVKNLDKYLLKRFKTIQEVKEVADIETTGIYKIVL